MQKQNSIDYDKRYQKHPSTIPHQAINPKSNFQIFLYAGYRSISRDIASLDS
jgi:hypothetical protein